MAFGEQVDQGRVRDTFVPGNEPLFPQIVPFLAVFCGASCGLEVGEEASSGVGGLVWGI